MHRTLKTADKEKPQTPISSVYGDPTPMCYTKYEPYSGIHVMCVGIPKNGIK